MKQLVAYSVRIIVAMSLLAAVLVPHHHHDGVNFLSTLQDCHQGAPCPHKHDTDKSDNGLCVIEKDFVSGNQSEKVIPQVVDQNLPPLDSLLIHLSAIYHLQSIAFHANKTSNTPLEQPILFLQVPLSSKALRAPPAHC